MVATAYPVPTDATAMMEKTVSVFVAAACVIVFINLSFAPKKNGEKQCETRRLRVDGIHGCMECDFLATA